jgi:hypothetical protein
MDGLPAGSPQAFAADKIKDRERKAQAALAKKLAALPPPLPSGPASAGSAAGAVAVNSVSVPGVAAGPGLVAAPTFVAWTQKQLEKPARLLTKIADRFRVWQLGRKVLAVPLPPAVQKEVLAELAYTDAALNDFNVALAECATVELNRRSVGGGQHSHWLNLALCAGELAALHLQTLDRLEKLAAKYPPEDLTAKNAQN